MSGEGGEGELQRAVRRKGSFVDTFKTVAWSFFGVRKFAEHEKAVGRLNPLHLVIAGLLLAAMFVGGLVLLVDWILSSGVARPS